MALGHCSHEHYPVLFEELPGLVEEYSRTKQRRGTAARPEEVSEPRLLILLICGTSIAVPPLYAATASEACIVQQYGENVCL